MESTQPPLRPTYSSRLYATTPSSFINSGSSLLIVSAARKYSSARLVAESWRCSIPMNSSGRCDLRRASVRSSQ